MSESKPSFEPEAELQFIADALEEADQWGVGAEVVQSALQYMSQNPDVSITDAMHAGLMEWVK